MSDYHTPEEPKENLESYDVYGNHADYNIVTSHGLDISIDPFIFDPSPDYNPATLY